MEKQKNSSTELRRSAPQLRFPEFIGDWETKKLKHIASFSKGKGISKSEISENGNIECIRYGQLYTHYNEVINEIISKTNVKLSELVLSESNDIIIPASGESQIDIAKASCVTKSGVALGGDLNIIKTENNGVFISYYLNSKKKLDIAKLAQGISVVHLYSSQLSLLNLNLPSLPEQQKIASFLTAVDDKLQALKKKKELLEQYKKGVMQKIFPSTGSGNTPEIRFKITNQDGELVEPPEWEKMKLNDFLEQEVREIDKPISNYLAIGIRSHCKGTFQKPDSDPSKIAMDKLFVVKPNDLIVNITFAWEGAIALVKNKDEDGLVSHRFPTYLFNKEKVIAEYFKYVFIQKKFRLMLELISPGGAGRNRVMSKKDFLKIKLNVPTVKEQTKIANFLSAIDKKIGQVAELVKATEQWKKGLLQKMFV